MAEGVVLRQGCGVEEKGWCCGKQVVLWKGSGVEAKGLCCGRGWCWGRRIRGAAVMFQENSVEVGFVVA